VEGTLYCLVNVFSQSIKKVFFKVGHVNSHQHFYFFLDVELCFVQGMPNLL
jgi:ribosomal protein S3AE